ncbi:hypothetical protein HY495_04000 [Candidatus Woesearchaeota archaeon]|nr:hypothetical protein [Candidatus Woesearchaeota archaeon]
MHAPFNRCVECNDVIGHPVCSDCLSEKMRLFVAEYDARLAKSINSTAIYGSSLCIFCGQNMALCPHCYSKDIYLFLHQKNKRIAREFLTRFDFELRKKFN